MKKLILLIMISVFTVSTVFAAFSGTAADTRITNTAFVGAGNLAVNVTNGIGTNVLGIDGGTWTATAGDQNATAGNTFTLSTWLSNNGNTNDIFVLTATNNTTNTPTGGAWTTALSNITTGAGPSITKCTLAAGAEANIAFRVTVNAAAGNGSYRTYVLHAQPGDGSSAEDNYNGDNGSAYGGTIGDDATYGSGYVVCNDASRSTARQWQVTIAGPVIAINKTIDSVAIADGNAPGNAAYPGATITYKISLTNSGGGAANSLFVRDSVPANTTYEAGSLKCDVANTTIAALTWAAGTPVTDGNANDAGATDGTDIEFCPGGTTADVSAGGEDGVLEDSSGSDIAACFYQVTIN